MRKEGEPNFGHRIIEIQSGIVSHVLEEGSWLVPSAGASQDPSDSEFHGNPKNLGKEGSRYVRAQAW